MISKICPNPLSCIRTVCEALTLLLVPVLTLIFSVYKCIVYVILKIRYGNRFRFMGGMDTVWSMEDMNSKSVITILSITDFDESKGDILDLYEKQLYRDDLLDAVPELNMKRKCSYGYYYFLKNEKKPSYVSKMREYDSIEDVRRLCGEYASESMGENNDAIIEVKIGTKPIKYNSDNAKNQYPMILKVHHSLGDGVSLNNLYITATGLDPVKFMQKNYEDVMEIQKKCKEKRLNKGATLNSVFPKIYNFPFFRKKESSILHGAKLSGKKNVAFKGESSYEYVRRVKNIKNRFKNVSFNNVVFTALSASFSDFYKKKNAYVPPHLVASLVVIPGVPDLDELATIENGKVVSLKMDNKFTVCMLKIPLTVGKKVEDDLIPKLAQVKSEIDAFASSADFHIYRLLMSKMSYIGPVQVNSQFSHHFESSIGISNLPGWDRLKLFHGSDLQDVFFWIPNYQKTGIGFSIFTYDNRFHFGLIADQALVPNPKDLDDILDGIFKYIDILDEKSKLLEA